MADEATSVEAVEETVTESLPEQEQEETVQAGEATPDTPSTDEPVDEKGVPVRNRQAEASRKAQKASQAQRELLTPSVPDDASTDEAIRLVEQIAEKRISDRIAPLLAKQFIMENPDAADMIEDINRIRSQYPEIAGVDKLDVAYKIARSERQDELIRQGVERQSKEREATIEKATRASAEGTGTTRAAQDSIGTRISNATSLKELQELEAMITK